MQPGEFALVILAAKLRLTFRGVSFSAFLALFRRFVAAILSSRFVLYIMDALA